jgi:hypothetical protein
MACRQVVQATATRTEQLNSSVTINNIQEIFFEMEETERLFNLQAADGTYFWDIVRRDVYMHLYTMHGGSFVGSPHLPGSSLISHIKDAIKQLLNKFALHYLESRAPQYIFITGQRIRQKGHLVDVISDHLYDLVSRDAVAVELMNKGSISYRKMLFGSKTRIPPVSVRRNQVENDLPQIVEAISSAIVKYFGISIDVHNLVLRLILVFRENKAFYLHLFARHRPNAIVCINNGTLYGLFSACKEMRVPILELQHGGSNSRTIFWSYPKSIPSSHPGLILPTAYLTFSEFWNGNTHFPVKVTHSIGNDYLHQKPIVGDDNGVLIVSTYMHHESLLQLAFELSDQGKQRNVYYKLHPHQFDQKTEIVAACRGRNIVVVSDDMDFAELFKLCNFVVGIHSTVLYISLQAGKKVCLYKKLNYEWHEDVFEYVELFDSASELCTILDGPQGRYFKNADSLPTLFQPFDPKRFEWVLGEVGTHA